MEAEETGVGFLHFFRNLLIVKDSDRPEPNPSVTVDQLTALRFNPNQLSVSFIRQNIKPAVGGLPHISHSLTNID